jgi:hypothetical protein
MRLAAVVVLCVPFVADAQSSICASCHPKIAQTYSRTGMARSFARPHPENTIEDYAARNTYSHAASGMTFGMSERAGRYFQSQFQVAADGARFNVSEKTID